MNNNLTYLHFSYDDSIATIHRYYRGTFIVLTEHLNELVALGYRNSHFYFSDEPFDLIPATLYVEIK